MLVYVKWKGLPLVPSRSAADEMVRHRLELEDIAEILENGNDGKKRKQGTHERYIRRGGCVVKAVVARSVNYSLKMDCWVITHVGVYKK